MAISHDMKMLPLTLVNFALAFKLEKLGKLALVKPYRISLTGNKKSHHYGAFEDMHNWFEYEINLMEGN